MTINPTARSAKNGVSVAQKSRLMTQFNRQSNRQRQKSALMRSLQDLH